MECSSISQLYPIFEEMLNSGRDITFSPDGISMMPMLRPKTDKVVISRPARPLKKHDIVFVKRTDGSLILHRIVRKSGRTLTLCGDGQTKLEKGIDASQVLGILKGYYRDGQYIIPKSFRYALYCKTLWMRRIKRRILSKTRNK